MMKNAVYVYNPSQTQAMVVFKNALLAMLSRWFNPIQFYDVTKEGTFDQVPTLVLCHNYSRIGTDIDDAVSGLPYAINRQHVAFVVIHMKAPHALPLTMPTETLVDPKYAAYGLLVDFAFQSDTELYSCNMNDVGKRKLTNFLDRYMDRSAARGSPTGFVQDLLRRLTNAMASFFEFLLSLIKKPKILCSAVVGSIVIFIVYRFHTPTVQ